MEVNRPGAVLAHAFADQLAVRDGLFHGAETVELLVLAHAGAVGAETFGHAGACRIFQGTALGRGIAGGIALHIFAALAAQQLPHRHAQRLAFQVPQRHVQRAQRMGLFAPRGIEIGPLHHLPVVLDAERVLADQQAGALFHGAGFAAFAHADQAGFGLDGDDVGGLVEGRLVDIGSPCRIGRCLVVADALDPVLGQAQRKGAGRCPQRSSGHPGHARHQFAAIHVIPP